MKARKKRKLDYILIDLCMIEAQAVDTRVIALSKAPAAG